MKTKKKRSSPEIEVIFPRNQVKTKKNNKGLRRNLRLFSSGNLQDLLVLPGAIFPLVIQRSALDGRTPKSRWGDAKSW